MAFDDSLRGYAFPVHKRDGFKCRFCGLDGTESFENWIRLSWDHLLPKDHPHRNDLDFIVAACMFCNTADNWYFKTSEERKLKFDGMSPQQLVEQRMPYVTKVRDDYRAFWEQNVSPSSSVPRLLDEQTRTTQLITIVESTMEQLAQEFSTEPTGFFTESDLTCRLTHLLSNSLDRLRVGRALDADGLPHQRIHCEYPTPFRCDMSNHGFQVKSDEDRTPHGGKYKRGHFDIVLINPSFIEQHNYSDLKGQEFAALKQRVLPTLRQSEPAILYGIELLFRRDDIKPSRGEDEGAAVDSFVRDILQDSHKLEASRQVPGFMKVARTLVFVKGSDAGVRCQIRDRLANDKSVTLVLSGE